MPRGRTKGVLPGAAQTYTCRECGKTLSSSSALQNHDRIHTGVKPFECDLCGKAFSQRSSLSVHKQTHSGNRPHVCAVCRKRFYQSSDLKRHMQSHLKQVPNPNSSSFNIISTNGAGQSHQSVHTVDMQGVYRRARDTHVSGSTEGTSVSPNLGISVDVNPEAFSTMHSTSPAQYLNPVSDLNSQDLDSDSIETASMRNGSLLPIDQRTEILRRNGDLSSDPLRISPPIAKRTCTKPPAGPHSLVFNKIQCNEPQFASVAVPVPILSRDLVEREINQMIITSTSSTPLSSLSSSSSASDSFQLYSPSYSVGPPSSSSPISPVVRLNATPSFIEANCSSSSSNINATKSAADLNSPHHNSNGVSSAHSSINGNRFTSLSANRSLSSQNGERVNFIKTKESYSNGSQKRTSVELSGYNFPSPPQEPTNEDGTGDPMAKTYMWLDNISHTLNRTRSEQHRQSLPFSHSVFLASSATPANHAMSNEESPVTERRLGRLVSEGDVGVKYLPVNVPKVTHMPQKQEGPSDCTSGTPLENRNVADVYVVNRKACEAPFGFKTIRRSLLTPSQENLGSEFSDDNQNKKYSHDANVESVLFEPRNQMQQSNFRFSPVEAHSSSGLDIGHRQNLGADSIARTVNNHEIILNDGQYRNVQLASFALKSEANNGDKSSNVSTTTLPVAGVYNVLTTADTSSFHNTSMNSDASGAVHVVNADQLATIQVQNGMQLQLYTSVANISGCSTMIAPSQSTVITDGSGTGLTSRPDMTSSFVSPTVQLNIPNVLLLSNASVPVRPSVGQILSGVPVVKHVPSHTVASKLHTSTSNQMSSSSIAQQVPLTSEFLLTTPASSMRPIQIIIPSNHRDFRANWTSSNVSQSPPTNHSSAASLSLSSIKKQGKVSSTPKSAEQTMMLLSDPVGYFEEHQRNNHVATERTRVVALDSVNSSADFRSNGMALCRSNMQMAEDRVSPKTTTSLYNCVDVSPAKSPLSRSSSPQTPPNTVAPEASELGSPSPIYRETAHSIFRSTCIDRQSNVPPQSSQLNGSNNVLSMSDGTKKFALPPRFMGKNTKYF